MAAERTEELRRALRAASLRATPSRIGVLALLRTISSPVSHGDVADRLASHGCDRATIYRNLMDLAEAGLARRTDLGDHVWRFEATSSAHAGAPHPHFVCTECGTVECLPDLELAGPKRARTPRALRTRQVEVHVRGLCDACA
ncbi:MAG TPA: transcriptional repressor [Kofleriaceae bacterium]